MQLQWGFSERLSDRSQVVCRQFWFDRAADVKRSSRHLWVSGVSGWTEMALTEFTHVHLVCTYTHARMLLCTVKLAEMHTCIGYTLHMLKVSLCASKVNKEKSEHSRKPKGQPHQLYTWGSVDMSWRWSWRSFQFRSQTWRVFSTFPVYLFGKTWTPATNWCLYGRSLNCKSI